MNIEKFIKEKQGTIVDVRTVEEFENGHASGSVNIPLQEIDKRLEELKSLPMPLILCCASGGRSGMATQMLIEKGLDCYNAGSWIEVNYYQSQINK